MPVLYADRYNEAHGRCDDCGTGSTDYREDTIRIFRIENAPQHDRSWYCDSCVDNAFAFAEDHSTRGWEDWNATPYWNGEPLLSDGNVPEDDHEFDPIPWSVTEEPRERGDSRAAEIEEDYSFSSDHKVSEPLLLLPVMEDRGARMISVEQELGRGGVAIAKLLHENGFAWESYINGYHSGDNNYFCKVEEDSSVDSEVIYQKMNLETSRDARKFEDALSIVRSQIEKGEAKLDMRCGTHVHVGLERNEELDRLGYSMDNVQSLYHLSLHLEDPLFRIASANWNKHRTEVAEHNYSPQLRRGLVGKANIGRRLEQDRGAVTFSHYLQSRSFCRCGAFNFADWENCVCDLPKATVEFRVFNATANLRKIHAYTALSLAMVEFAFRNECKAEDFPPNPFARTDEFLSQSATKAGWEFIMSLLPLTSSEHEDLLYCAENSSLTMVM